MVHCPRNLWETLHGRRISQKHLDFVLYDRTDARVIAAVELDDRSHDRRDRRERDEFVDRTLVAAGVVLIRFRAAANYDPMLIRRHIDDATAGKA